MRVSQKEPIKTIVNRSLHEPWGGKRYKEEDSGRWIQEIMSIVISDLERRHDDFESISEADHDFHLYPQAYLKRYKFIFTSVCNLCGGQGEHM